VTTTTAVASTWHLDAAQLERAMPGYPTGYPTPWALPSMGNARQYGGLPAPPMPGQAITYSVARPGPVPVVVDRPPAPDVVYRQPTPQPAQPQEPARQPRRVIQPEPPPPPERLPTLPYLPPPSSPI
jgi:hypothetical protein